MLTDSYLYSGKGSLPDLLPATFLLYPHLSFPLCMDKGHKWVLVCVPFLVRTPCKSLGFGPLPHDLAVVQLLSHAQLFATPWTNCSTPGFPVLHHLPEFAQSHVHWVSDSIQPSHPLFPTSPLAFGLFQHQGFFQRVSSSHQEAKGGLITINYFLKAPISKYSYTGG